MGARMQATPLWVMDPSSTSQVADVIVDFRHPDRGASHDPHADDIIRGAETEGNAIIIAETAAGSLPSPNMHETPL